MPDPLNPYRAQVATLCATYIGQADSRVDNISAILGALLLDLEAGIHKSVVEAARAEVFEDFLSQAKHYVGKADRIGPAGVIAGVVFEDTVRRACVRQGITKPGEDVKLDVLIARLKDSDAINDVTAARCRAAPAVRTKATHAQWTEFGRPDVEETIAVAELLVERLLKA
jgi:hypothetical protein